MIHYDIDAFLMQKTCIAGNKIQVIKGCTVFYHGLKESKFWRREKKVAITLSQKFTKFYEIKGGSPQKMISQDGNYAC